MSNYLVHHGILGMKWGVRRYQNPDGSLTELGKKHYNTPEYQKEKAEADLVKFQVKQIKSDKKRYYNPDGSLTELGKKHFNTLEYQEKKAKTNLTKFEAKQTKEEELRRERNRKIVRVVAGVALTAGAIYATKKILDSSGSKKIADAAKTAIDGEETVKKAFKETSKKAAKEAAKATAKEAAKDAAKDAAKKTAKEATKATFASAFKETALAKKDTIGPELGVQLANSGADIIKSAFGVPGKIGKVLVEGAALTGGMALVKSMIGEEKLNQTVDAYNSYNKKNKISMNPFKDNYKPAKEEDKEDD